jgi:hypothetical protein
MQLSFKKREWGLRETNYLSAGSHRIIEAQRQWAFFRQERGFEK